jgi:hypothetical protein
METKTKTFDAVAESRNWREASSRKLNAMTRDERLSYLQALGRQVRLECRRRTSPKASASSEASG